MDDREERQMHHKIRLLEDNAKTLLKQLAIDSNYDPGTALILDTVGSNSGLARDDYRAAANWLESEGYVKFNSPLVVCISSSGFTYLKSKLG